MAGSAELSKIYDQDFTIYEKNDGSPVTDADLASSKAIYTILEESKLPILGEESEHQPFSERKNWTRNWCVDPLDGTKEFIRKNGEFVVCIALIENHESILGVIASPINKEIIIGGKSIGAFSTSFENAIDQSKWIDLKELSEINDPILVTASRSHYSGSSLELINKVKAKFGTPANKKMGSALKFFDLVRGIADVYPRFAPTMEWDIAAGHAIYEAVGGEVLDAYSGESLRYNRKNIKNPHFIAKKKVIQLD